MTQEFKVINSFREKWYILSNFYYPVTINYKGINFPSVEHAYQASKSASPSDWAKVSQIPANQPGKAKRFGRKVKLISDWDIIKIPRMEDFLIQKYTNKECKIILLETKDALLIEGNYWHDNFWGNCYCSKCKSIIGQNNLGKLLMKVRSKIRNEQNILTMEFG